MHTSCAFMSRGSVFLCCLSPQVTKPGTWSYTVSYDGKPAVQGVKIAGQSGELDPRKLNLDVSKDTPLLIPVI